MSTSHPQGRRLTPSHDGGDAADGDRTGGDGFLCEGAARIAVIGPSECVCDVSIDGERLVVDPGGCGGDLVSAAGCRATVVHTLADRDVSTVAVRGLGRVRPRGVALLVAAGRFRSLLDGREPRTAALAGREPLAAAREAGSRGGWLSATAAESGLALAAEGLVGYGVLEPADDRGYMSRSSLPSGMFYEQRTTVPGTARELRAEYEAELAPLVEGVGVEAAAAETGVETDRLAALVEGDSPPLDLEEAAAIVALGEGEPDAGTAVEMACEHLLLGMATAVLDVDAVAGELALDLDPKEVQQKLERRAPMSLEEFVHFQYVIVGRMP